MTERKKQSAGCRGYGVCSRVLRVVGEHGWVPCFCLQKHAFRLRFATPKKHGTLPRRSRGTQVMTKGKGRVPWREHSDSHVKSEIGNRQATAGFALTSKSAIAKGFTLIELMVVVMIIALMAGVALPTIRELFRSGSDEQAYNVISAQIAAARAVAILENTYAGVHVQMSDRPDQQNICYAAIVKYDGTNFALADGYMPQRVPGNIAFGELSGDFVNGNAYINGAFDNVEDPPDFTDGLDHFTTFTIVFSPAGQVVNNVEGGDVSFGSVETPLFNLAADDIENTDTQLWKLPADELGVSAIVLFDYKTLKALDGDGREDYLNENGQFLALNIYTGRFFFRY